MKADAPDQNPKRTQIGAITYLSAGGETPGAPWTMPTSPLVIFGPGGPTWPMPVKATVNNKPPTTELLSTAQPAQQRQAPAAWTNSFGAVVAGHVLDPASTPELRDLPAGIARVVIAADDPSAPIRPEVLGSPVTVDLDGATSNLGVIVGTDGARHWIVVDLISGFLAAQGARLITTN